jgi:hypothetical protein
MWWKYSVLMYENGKWDQLKLFQEWGEREQRRMMEG